MNRTLAEALAIAVLKGDMAAAYALKDRLEEEKEIHPEVLVGRIGTVPLDGYTVYQMKEFREFCRAVGIKHGLHTIELTIILPADGMVEVRQTYAGEGYDEQNRPLWETTQGRSLDGRPVDTTTLDQGVGQEGTDNNE